MNRKELLAYINQVSFMVNDIQLYLDTHPWDTEALKSFHEYSQKRTNALKDYAKLYGPLTVDNASVSCADRWNWINEPWPWQEGGC